MRLIPQGGNMHIWKRILRRIYLEMRYNDDFFICQYARIPRNLRKEAGLPHLEIFSRFTTRQKRRYLIMAERITGQ